MHHQWQVYWGCIPDLSKFIIINNNNNNNNNNCYLIISCQEVTWELCAELHQHIIQPVISRNFFFLLFSEGWDWVHLVLCHSWPIVWGPEDRWWWLWSNCGMKIDRGNINTQRKPAPAPFCPSQIPHDQTWAQTRATMAGSQQLTAQAMAQPLSWSWSILHQISSGHRK
jgi:hypothetical protein